MTRAVLFIGHGTRDAAGMAEFHQFVDAVEHRLSTACMRAVPGKTPLFERCFLELQPPGIEAAVASLHGMGVTHILVAPLLLFAAGHLKNDIPQALDTATKRYPDITVECMDAVGIDGCFLDVAASRLHEAGFPARPAHAQLVLVGRGNRDESAQRAFAACADRLRQTLGLSRVEVGYLAGSGETLESALSAARAQSAGPLYVLPYLWFHGWLTVTLPTRIEAWRNAQNPSVDVVIAQHLGPDERLVQRVADTVLPKLPGLAGR